MSTSSRQLSNPVSTGGGGAYFEAHIQAMFVTLMLTGGFAPYLPPWPIVEIKLQGKVSGFDVDDLVVYVENPDDKRKSKLLGQIKRSISITKTNQQFGEVLQAAWHDFNNKNLFNRGSDFIALITGPLSKTDTNDAIWLLDHARCTRDAEEFFRDIAMARFSSNNKREKLLAFRDHLKEANGGSDVPEESLHSFLRHFCLIGCDLGKEEGVTRSLLYSHMSQSDVYPPSTWGRIVEIVQARNQHAGTITPEDIPEDLRKDFERPERETFPSDFSPVQVSSEEPDWNQHAHASALVIANLLGAWNEENEADLDVIHQLASS